MNSTHDIFNAADRGEFARLAISTLSELLRHAFASGEDMRHWQDGLPFLFEPHLEAIEEANDALRSYIVAAQEAAATSAGDSEKVHGLRRDLIASAVGNGVQPGEIAAALNMSRSKIDRVIAQLKGETESEAEPQRKVG